ncbi:MAG: ATP-binding protein [Solirubrobacteraceae bacterium]
MTARREAPAADGVAVVVTGPPASGKTTLATALASALGYAIVDLDTVTGPLTRLALALLGATEDAIDGPAGGRLRAPRYDALIDVAAANLRAGIGVVLAAPFSEERADPGRWDALARRLAPAQPDRVALLYLDVPPSVLRSRLQARDAARDAGKLSSPAGTAGAPRLVPGAAVLDGTRNLSEQLAAALDVLGTRGGPVTREPHASSC